MPTIQCSGKTDSKACLESFTTQDALHKNAKFTCKVHTGKSPNAERFQGHQFDVELGRPVDALMDENGIISSDKRHMVKRLPGSGPA